MPEIVDRLILDPPEFAVGRTPLDLTGAGLSVVEAEFGEAAIETQLIRQQLGEAVTDRHEPNKEIGFKLRVREEGEFGLPEIATALQQKVGVLAREGGWLQRDFKVGGNFGSLACEVKRAALANFSGWQRGESPDVTLALFCGPLWYATDEIPGSVFSLGSGQAMEFEEPEVLGTASGLMRLRVKNTGASNLRGMIVALESRDHPQSAAKSTTAKLMYEAEKLTLAGGATIATRTLASGGGSNNVVRASLTAGWSTILQSLINGVGHMTHVGIRRLRVRVYDPGSSPGGVELKAQFRPLGALAWTDTFVIRPTRVTGNFSLLDLGECRPERAVLGDQRWEWRILARAPGSSGEIDLDVVYIEPVEQHAVVRAPDMSSANQLNATRSPGKGETVGTGAGAAVWAGPENIKTSDEARATAELKSGQFSSNYLRASSFGFAVPSDATIVALEPSIERSATEANKVEDINVRVTKGAPSGFGAPGWAWEDHIDPNRFWPTSDQVRAYLPSKAIKVWGLPTYAEVNSPEFAVWLWAINGPVSGSVTARVDQISLTVYYALPEDASICYQTRSIEFRSDGAFRQHATDNVWGEVVNEGQHPYAAPSYLEGRAMRGLIVPSAGDLGDLADPGSHSLEAQMFYRPAYHFARQALES
jgi:hypothetical protein